MTIIIKELIIENEASYPQNYPTDFNPDERAMKYGAELLARYAYEYLK